MCLKASAGTMSKCACVQSHNSSSLQGMNCTKTHSNLPVCGRVIIGARPILNLRTACTRTCLGVNLASGDSMIHHNSTRCHEQQHVNKPVSSGGPCWKWHLHQLWDPACRQPLSLCHLCPTPAQECELGQTDCVFN